MTTAGLDTLLRRRVVLDTNGSMLYIGTLEAHDAGGYWLADADVHDRRDGHSTKEEYISEAHDLERAGSRRINRKRVLVERHAVVSISALDDVVSGGGEEEGGAEAGARA
ncbi:MAG: hypothetical protein CHACPFDD_01713 [Phycisphaerae bacterium]|nr:hypothetical protein [Phycisphaerae bacterium]